MTAVTRRSFVKNALVGTVAATSVGLTLGEGQAYAETLDGTVLGANSCVTQANDSTEKYQAIFDVVVAGAGCAGLSAALEAARSGAKVALIEALPNYYEANSSLCGGMIWGWNTPLHAEAGVAEVSREESLAYLAACGGGHESTELAEILVDEADAQYDWLVDLGVEFPLELLSIYGAEYNFEELFEPRPHTLVCMQQSGRGLTDALYQGCLDAGVEFIFDAPATNLITDPTGRVVGVATPKGNFRGNRGIVLATSGFSMNQSLVDSFIPDLAGSCAGSHSTGDGIVMGAAIGAKLHNMWCMQAFSVGTLLKSGVGICNKVSAVVYPNIEVGSDGLRHYDEGCYYEDKYAHVNDRPDHMMWSVWDQSVTDMGASALFCPPCSDGCEAEIADGVVLKADTFEELAEQMGVDPAVFTETVARYNKMAEAGIDEDFGRFNNLAPVATAPYYAAKIVSMTCDSAGGLVINAQAEVLNWADNPIPGLFAAGATTAGWRGDTYPGCGLAITNGIVFGRRAGANAAAQTAGEYTGQLADDAGAYLETTGDVQVELAENEYLGSAMGMGGTVTVKVGIEGASITSVEVVDHDETEGIGSRAVEALPARIVEAGTYDVDAVGGATITSSAICTAVQQALAEAGLA